MKYGSPDVGFILIDGYSLAGVNTELTESMEAITEEAHGFGEEWVRHSPVGLTKAELEQNGYYDDEADSSHDALKDSAGVNRIMSYNVEGNEIGRACVNWQGLLQITYNRVISRGALHRANAKYAGNGALEEGIVLQPLEEMEGNGQSTVHDNDAATTEGVAFYLQVVSLDLDGATDVTITVEDSANGIDFDTLETFTAVTAGPTVERKVKAGTIRQYLRVKRAFNGGTSPTIEFMVSGVRY